MPAPRTSKPTAAPAAVALIAALLLVACGGGGPDPGPPDELSKKDSTALTDARAGLDTAVRAEARLSASPRAARTLRGKVQSIVSEGAFETAKLDQFGLAALGRLELLAPSLVEVDSDGVPVALDVEATRAFLRYAERDPARALLAPVERHVGAIERTVGASRAGPDTRILPGEGDAAPGLRVERYLQEAEGAVQPIWPDPSGRLHVLRAGL